MPVETVGAQVTADGIAASDRGSYAFQPPAAFFETAVPLSGPGIFNILDYGAKADPGFDNREEIQAAINAAHNAGGGIVYVPPGTYGIGNAFRSDGVTPDPSAGGVKLLDNVFLKGAGMGLSTLRVLDGLDQAITGIVRSPSATITNNFGAADLTLDGNRANNPTAKTDAFYCGVSPGSPAACSDVYLLRVEAQNCKGYGFDPHEQTNRLSITDCVAHGNGLDGFTEDFQVDGEFRGNVAYGNDRHGFNIVTTTSDSVFIDNIAHDNGGAGIVVQRGSTDIPAPSNILIQGGQVYGNASDGIRIVYSSDVLVNGVDIHDNGRNGVRIEGSSNVTVANNSLSDNGQLSAGTVAEIQIQPIDDRGGASGIIHRSTGTFISGNTITETETENATIAVRESVGSLPIGTVDGTLVVGNTVVGLTNNFIQLSGPNSSVVQQGNDGNDTLSGGPGTDYLISGGGSDRLTGAGGDDVYFVNDAADRIVEAVGGGFDTEFVSAAITVTMAANVEQLILSGSAVGGIGSGGNDIIQAIGTTGGVTIDGKAGDDVLLGGAGNDTISGGSGNDVLDGGGGANTLSGGTGNDIYVLTTTGDKVIEASGAGFDTEFSSAAGITVMAANVEQLVLTGSAGGATGTSGNDIISAVAITSAVTLDGGGGNDVLFGGAGNDTLKGGSGNDVLVGGAGANTLDGGSGDDLYVLTSGSDTITETAEGGYDVAYSTVAGTTFIAANVEQLILAGAATGGMGSSANNVISTDASAGAVVIDGAGGDDFLFGGSGADRLTGGSGNDYLAGGAGSDVFDFRAAGSGVDVIADFTAAGAAHDFIDVSSRGFTAASIGVSILIADSDGVATITVGTDTIKLIGVQASEINSADFIF